MTNKITTKNIDYVSLDDCWIENGDVRIEATIHLTDGRSIYGVNWVNATDSAELMYWADEATFQLSQLEDEEEVA